VKDGGRAVIGLGPGAEFDLIRRFLLDSPSGGDEVVVGPGDDAAVLEGGRWAITCDQSVEEVHFRRSWMSPEQIGYRATVVALSDLAAMAARPVAVLPALALPLPLLRDGTAEAVQRGIAEAARSVGATVVGGDVSRSPGPLVANVTALGVVEGTHLRSDAVPGDELWVTGRLGGAGEAVRRLLAGDAVAEGPMEAFLRPTPRVEEALWLAGHVELHALIDLSDGLASDAGHLAAASGVAVLIAGVEVPVHPGVSGDSRRERALGALEGGDDYELAFTAAAGSVRPAQVRFEERFGIPLTRIGRIEHGEGVWWVPPGAEDPEPLSARGFDHLAPEGA
jgi:thiamine-monophosphate kinase